MFCNACGLEVGAETYCANCGALQRCGCGTALDPADSFCATCGKPTPRGATSWTPRTDPTSRVDAASAREWAEVRARVGKVTGKVASSVLAMGIFAGVLAFLAVVIVAAIAGYGTAHLLASSIHPGGSGAGVARHTLGHLGGALTRYYLFSFFLVPAHLSVSAGFGPFQDSKGANLILMPLVGLSFVAAALFWAGRFTARRTKVDAVTTDRLVQGLIAGAVYAVILVWFASASVTHFSINLLVVSGSASVGPNRAEVLGAGIVWGGLFATLGALSSTDSSPGRHLLAAAGDAWDWVVGFYATVAATLAAGVVLWVAFVVWAGDALARARPLSASGTDVTKTLPALGLLLFGANAAALGLLRGMGVPAHWVGGGDAGLVSLPAPAQVGCSVAVVAAMILAGWLTRARTTQRLTAVGFGARVAVPFAVMSWLVAAAAPLEVTSGHHAYGLAVPLLPALGLGFVETFSAAIVGAQLAIAAPGAFERVPLLRSFAGPPPPQFDQLIAFPNGRGVPWNRALGVLSGLLFVGIGVATVGWRLADTHYSPGPTTVAYLTDVNAGQLDAASDLTVFPSGDGPLVSRAGLTAMYRSVPPTGPGDIHVDAVTVRGSRATVRASWGTGRSAGSGTFRLRRSDTRHDGLFPRWQIVPDVEQVNVDGPGDVSIVSIDGQTMPAGGGSATATVLAGAHRFAVGAGALTEATSSERSIDAGTDDVNLPAPLTPAGQRAAHDAVSAWFDACTGGPDTVASSCPQSTSSLSLDGVSQQNESWTLVADPATGMAVTANIDGTYTASGTWQMTFNYLYDDGTGNLAPATAPTQGAFDLTLSASGDSFTVAP